MDTTAEPGLRRRCPLCGDSAARLYLEKGTQRLQRCLRCSMVYADWVPSTFAGGEHYTLQGEYYVAEDKLQSDFSPVRYERELRWFTKFCRGGSLLDVGCSSGAFMHQLKQRFPERYQLCGVEISRPALAHARSLGLAVEEGNLLALDLGARRFDAVSFWAVLEHVVDPAAYLRKAAELLRPGGWCFVLVPNLNSLAVRCLGGRYRYFMEEHINWFGRVTLRRVLEPFFAIRHLTTTHFNPLVIAQDARRPRVVVPAAERAALLRRTTAWKMHRALGPARLGYRVMERALSVLGLADNLLAVAQRE